MNQKYKINVIKALAEFQYSKLTESKIAKLNHISRVTLSKYIHLNNITRKHSLYSAPKKPAKKLSDNFKYQRHINKLRHYANEYIQQASLRDATNYIINGLYIIKERCRETSSEAYHEFIRIFGDGK